MNRYRLIQTVFDHRRGGRQWKVAEYSGEEILDAPRRLRSRVRLHSLGGQHWTTDVTRDWVRVADASTDMGAQHRRARSDARPV